MSEPTHAIESRREFEDAVRRALARAAETGAPAITIVDPTFADWPLNDRAVIDSLERWVDSRKRLTVFGHDFDDFGRRQMRFVEWRRRWSHVVQVRADPDREAGEVPGLLLVDGLTCVRVLDRVHLRGIASDRGVDLTACRESIDALLQRSVETFPVTTLGL